VLSDKAPYEQYTPPSLEEALRRAYGSRWDYQAAAAQVRAADLSRRAASAQRYPTFDVEGDYGGIGVNPGNSNGTFHVAGTVTVPVFQGGKTHADVLQAEATLREAKARLDDLRGQIDNGKCRGRRARRSLLSARTQRHLPGLSLCPARREASAHCGGRHQRKEAEDLVDTVDRERMAFIKHYFNADWPTRSLYHVMLNTVVGDDHIIATILNTMRLLQEGSPAGESSMRGVALK
jgi:hypothetical protein